MTATRVLIVDDNKAYREAFRRNLALRGYEVREAEDSRGALDAVQTESATAGPDVIVTDLAMRHPTEGLELIRQIRALQPLLPVIMISAVGTFDEGAEAVRLGACQVISKSKIDEEMSNLYEAINAASRQYAASRRHQARLTELAARAESDAPGATAALGDLLKANDVPLAVKSEAFDLLLDLSRDETGQSPLAAAPKKDLFESATKELWERVDESLLRVLPALETFDLETRQNLRTAEFLFQQSEGRSAEADFSRSMGFAYCFAVENEVKARLKKKLQKFLNDPATLKLVEGLLESNRRSLSIFYQQHLLRIQQSVANEATMENFLFVFLRILEHKGRYKPDGLKAIGIILICFGRAYGFRKLNQEVKIDNPLELRGLEGPDEAVRLGAMLINLQHSRNPYIHPEISEMAKLSKIREQALDCLKMIEKIQ